MLFTRLSAILLLLLLSQAAIAQTSPRTISTTGVAVITVEAEYAKIHTQLKVVGKSAEESYNQVMTTLLEISTKLEKLGLTKEDLVTSVIIQGAEYDWQNNSRMLMGYFSSCSLQIRVDSIKSIYRIHNELSLYPILTIGHTEYGRKDESLLRTTALQEALRTARGKALAMAQAVDAELGPVLNIREAGASFPVPVGRQEAAFMSKAADLGDMTTTGSITITGEVAVDFELK